MRDSDARLEGNPGAITSIRRGRFKDNRDPSLFQFRGAGQSSGQWPVSVLNCRTSVIPWMRMEHDSGYMGNMIVFPKPEGEAKSCSSNNFVIECRPDS